MHAHTGQVNINYVKHDLLKEVNKWPYSMFHNMQRKLFVHMVGVAW